MSCQNPTMAPSKEQNSAWAQLAAPGIGATASHNKTSQKETTVCLAILPDAEGVLGQELSMTEQKNDKLNPTDVASLEDKVMSKRVRNIQEDLSTEILWMILEGLPDLKSVGAAIRTCKKIHGAFVQHHKSVRAILLKHGGQGLIGCTQAIAAVKTPVMNDQAAKDVDNLVIAMRAFWGGDPIEATVNGMISEVIAQVKASRGEAPGPVSSFVSLLKAQRWAPEDILSRPILVPEKSDSTNNINNDTNTNNIINILTQDLPVDKPTWRFDPTLVLLTSAEAIYLAKLGQCVHRLAAICTVAMYRNQHHQHHHQQQTDQGNIPSQRTLRIQDALWRIESFRLLFGSQACCKRLEHSTRLDTLRYTYTMGAHGRVRSGRVQAHEAIMMESVYSVLFRLVMAKWDVVTAGGAKCQCFAAQQQQQKQQQTGQQGQQQPATSTESCSKCRRRGTEGAFTLGLKAVCRILEADEADLNALKGCFVWSNGMPLAHPYFLDFLSSDSH